MKDDKKKPPVDIKELLDMRVQIPSDEKIVCMFVSGNKVYVATERKVYSVPLTNYSS